jgi:V/A-type H+-transporting ATPase subunit D
MGVVSDIAETFPVENSVTLSVRSVMGVELPKLSMETSQPEMCYGMYQTNSQFDAAYISFNRAKELTVKLAEIENSIYRLAIAIKKTQKRANALKNILIPKFTGISKYISDSLEEKEREEFSRLKVIKTRKSEKNED